LPTGVNLLNVSGDGDLEGGGWALRPFALAGFGMSGTRPGGAVGGPRECARDPWFARPPRLARHRARDCARSRSRRGGAAAWEDEPEAPSRQGPRRPGPAAHRGAGR